jgi:LmbE family N-acetylglucosaminyl deacetylase
MSGPLRLMVAAAHPDDETLGFGGVLVRYAREGVDTSLISATRGQRGRYMAHAFGTPDHPGPAALGAIREKELEAAACALGIGQVSVLDYEDQHLDRADPSEAIAAIAAHIRRVRPHVILTFPPDGAYGHPDHVAISQFTTSAVVAAADARYGAGEPHLGPAHTVAKLYYLAWDGPTWAAYEAAFKKLAAVVDGVERQATAWPSWALTTIVETGDAHLDVWRAVECHASQMRAYEALKSLAPEQRAAIWRTQSFYRTFSLVNGGRARETDLFEGLR